jgi:hypothetical protein
LAHPLCLVALAVLLVNDHVLKAAWPGPVTGKLSDVAGLVFAPSVLAAVVLIALPRLPARAVAVGSVLAVALGFTVVKTATSGAAFASDVLSVLSGPSLVRRDPTDLVALPALGLAWAAYRWAGRRPAPDRLVRLVRVGVLLPVALLAVAATSQPNYPTATGVIASEKGFLLSTTGTPDQPGSAHLTSYDGLDWSYLPVATRPPLPPGASSECVDREPAHCYRIVAGQLRVDETVDGGAHWSTVWSVSPGRREFLNRALAMSKPAPSGVAVAVGEVEGGHVVVVANGRAGLAVRDVRGGWHDLPFENRQGFGGSGFGGPPIPLTEFGARIGREITLGVLLALLVIGVTAEVARQRRGLDRLPTWRKAIGVTGALLLAAVGFLAMLLAFGNVLLLGIGLIIALAWTIALLQWRMLRGPDGLLFVAGGVASGVLLVIPFLGWTVAVPDRYGLAVVLGAVTAAVPLVLTLRVARRRPRRLGSLAAPGGAVDFQDPEGDHLG